MNVLHINMKNFPYLQKIRMNYEKPFTARPQFSAVYTAHIQSAPPHNVRRRRLPKKSGTV